MPEQDTPGADAEGAEGTDSQAPTPGGGNFVPPPPPVNTHNPSFCFDAQGRVRDCTEGEVPGQTFFDTIGPSILEFLNQINGPGGGGGGGATGQTGAEGQESGSGQPPNVQALRDLLTTLVSQQSSEGPPTFQLDPRFAEAFGNLQQEAADSAGRLLELDPAARADFEAQEQARLAEVDEQARQGRDQLLARLFGSGAQQSTVAASQAGDFEAAVARAQQGVRSDIAGQRLDTRQFLTQNNLANLQLRFDALAQEQQGALTELGINAEAVNAERNRNSRLLSDIIGFETQERTAVTTANIGANAQIRSAQIAASASRHNARLGAATDLANLSLQRELGLLNRDSTLRGLDLQRRGQDIDFRIARETGQRADAAARRASRDQNIATAASLAIGLAVLFSDERLKQDIKTEGLFGPLRIVSYRYLGKATRQIGFIAQEVKRYFPGAVIELDGFLAVDYAALGV